MGFADRADSILDGVGTMLSTATAKSFIAFGATAALIWNGYKLIPADARGTYFLIFVGAVLAAQAIVTGRSIMDDFAKRGV